MIDKTLILLNAYAVEFFNNIKLNEIHPIEFNGDDSLTVAPDDTSSFNLNNTKNNITYITPNLNEVEKLTVIRQLVSYADACKMAENQMYFNYKVSLLVNNALATLKRNCGSLHKREITAFRPGQGTTVFRDLENSAAYELRIILLRKKTDE